MCFDEVMKIILPPREGLSPAITFDYYDPRLRQRNVRQDDGTVRKVDVWENHGGVDFNYKPGGQWGLNTQHPDVHPPVTGTVKLIHDGFNTIQITDGDGYHHALRHSHEVKVKDGGEIKNTDTPIATMGKTAPPGKKQMYHVHYEMFDPKVEVIDPHTKKKDTRGRRINPEDFWSPKAIRVSDKTITGAPVVSGSENLLIENQMAARVGDTVTCPKCAKSGVITSGCASILVEGRPLAVQFSTVVCGCPAPSTLETTQRNVSTTRDFFKLALPDNLVKSFL